MRCQWHEEGQSPSCSNEAVVGVGHTVVWVCQVHYEEYLAMARRVLDAVMEAYGR